jgi:hypothetical protein
LSSFEEDVDWEGLEEVKEAKAAQRVLGLEDFITDDDKAEQSAFELARHLSEVDAEVARQRAALEARVNFAVVRKYEQWQAEAATRYIKKDIIDLDNK